MSNIVDIEDQTPHFCIHGVNNNVHIVSKKRLQRIVIGKSELVRKDQEDSGSDMIRGIIREWLKDRNQQKDK